MKSYNKIYGNVYADLITTDGSFSIKQVMFTTFLNSPKEFTKADIEKLAFEVLDEALNAGMVRSVGEGKYESILSHESDKFIDQDNNKEDILGR